MSRGLKLSCLGLVAGIAAIAIAIGKSIENSADAYGACPDGAS